MPNQANAWEKEYRNPKLMTGDDKPQSDTLSFLKFLKKEEKYKVEGRNILDLGSGTGRNANYLAEMGNNIVGIEISKTAIDIAKQNTIERGISVEYKLGDIGEPYNIADDYIDIVLDITSSNSLNEKGREIYLKEVSRVLKQGGYFFVRALAKDGNKNVKNLLKQNPGKEYDTYFIPELNLIERVFSKEDFIEMYGKYFEILNLIKKTSYSKMNGRIYKRDYWLAYMQK